MKPTLNHLANNADLTQLDVLKLAQYKKEFTEQFAKLTEQEQNIVRLIANEKTNKEIALKLTIAEKTVDNHRTHIHKKLDLHGRDSLVFFAALVKIFE